MPGASAPAPNVPPDLAALIAAALGRAVIPGERAAVAVSGGPDSLALLTLAAAAFPGGVTALTVDHGLRAGSAAEAASVAAQCGARGIPHRTLVRAGPAFTANRQAQARAARYDLLGRWCAGHGHSLLLTAHHADDQAETLLMRLGRRSGSGGLAGIRNHRTLLPQVTLVRPLLGWRKTELAAIAAAAGWQAADDPSNHDPRHDRTRMRALLAAAPGLDVAALAASAAYLAADAQALAWAADLAWEGRVSADGGALRIDAAGLPQALVQRVLARAIAVLAGRPARGGDVARMAARLAAGKTCTLAGIRAHAGSVWHLAVTRPPQCGSKSPPEPGRFEAE